jgi:hypothetical protein
MLSAVGLLDALAVQDELAEIYLLFGNLDAAMGMVDACLGVAVEVDRRWSIGVFLGLRGRLRALSGDGDAAVEDFREALDHLRAAHAQRDRNQYELELIDLAPDSDPDGERVAAVIEHEAAVGERRLLPRAWRLEARRLRLAGAIQEAALALEEAFRVAGTLDSPEHRWPLHLEAAELALAAGEAEAARKDLQRAVEILRDLSLQFPPGPARARFLARADRRRVLDRLRSLEA